MLASKHHPDGGATAHCDSVRIASLIAEYQTSRDVKSLGAIVDLTQDRARALIRFYRTTRYRPMDELLSDVNFKLVKAVEKFDPEKGSAFTFVSKVISNVLFTSVVNARKELERNRKLSKVVLDKLLTNGESESADAIDDIMHRIRSGARTTLTDATELSVQRWFVASFCADGFEHRRHECANAAMVVFPSVQYERSRELYDLTMLEVRRVLYDDLPHRSQIVPGRLRGTRLTWITRYAPLLDAEEFTKFVTLMRDLSPFVILLVDPANRSRRQDRCSAISRKNIEFVLHGHPDAVPLFP
jgi:hypothetical protein